MGHRNTPRKAPPYLKKKIPAVPLTEIVMEWLDENTENTEWTTDDLAKIARLIVRFSEERVVK